MTTDAELVILAQAGDIASLGTLLERHRPRMLAVALSILGPGPDAHDAVQESCILALGRVGQLRSPDAIGSWLNAIVRHVCLNTRRGPQREIALSLFGDGDIPATPFALEDMVDHLALRDWVWTAIDALPESLQVVVMLRYFGKQSTYADIATTLSIPVGTVRSRLSDARTRMAKSLVAFAESPHDDARSASLAFQQQFGFFVDRYNRGVVDPGKIATYAPDISGVIGQSPFHGRESLVHELRQDTLAGVKLHLRTVLASPHVAVCEATWENPPEAPGHCPPGMAYIEFIRDGLVQSLRVVYAPRPAPNPV